MKNSFLIEGVIEYILWYDIKYNCLNVIILFLHLTYTFIRLSYKKLICTLLTRREYLNMIPGVPKKLDIVNKNDISMWRPITNYEEHELFSRKCQTVTILQFCDHTTNCFIFVWTFTWLNFMFFIKTCQKTLASWFYQKWFYQENTSVWIKMR